MLMDKKGIGTYLGITLAASYGLWWLIVRTGDTATRPYVILIIPAVSAWVALRISPGGAYVRGVLWPIPKVAALRMTFVVPVLFALLYAIGALCRLTPPDWQLTELMLTLPSAEQLQLPAALAPMLPNIYLGMSVVLVILLGPTLYALTMLPNEFGWRGYLLPRLMPLGRWPAYILSGIFWWLSFLPLVLWRGGTPLVNALLSLGMAVTLSAATGEVWRRSQHLGLTAVCSGCLVCQASTICLYLFPTINTGFPWPSRFGPVTLVVFAVVAVVPSLLFGRLEPKAAGGDKKAAE